MKKLLYLSLAAFLMTSGSSMTFANPGGGSSGGSSGQAVKKCKKGEVVKKVNNVKKCVKVGAGILPDDELYEQGRVLAKAGQYEWALQVLAAIQNQNDPRVLNYTGYSNRKAGRIEIGITYYRKALAIDPNFVLAREYLGEGYVQKGDLVNAKVHLAKLEVLCGTTCEQYKDLAASIAGQPDAD